MAGYRSVAEHIAGARGFQLPIDKHVLGVLSTFADYQTGAHATMSLNTLSTRSGLTRSTLCRALRRLEDGGWIRGERRHRAPTRYDINLDLLKTCWTSVESLLKTSGLRPTGDTQLRPTGDTQEGVLRVTGGTPSPVQDDPHLKDHPQTEEAALRATVLTEVRQHLKQLTFGPSGEASMRAWRNKHGRRPMLPTDNVGATCDCLECRAAEVTHLARVRVPADAFSDKPRWLHGEELKAWYAERERGLAAMRAAVPARRGRR